MTPAVTSLEEAKVAYTLHEYEVSEAVGDGYGEAVAEAIGAPARSVYKTLLAVADDEPVVAIIPVSARLSLKSLARAAGAKKASMADPTDAERLTGYVKGGISPLGQRRRHTTFLDSSALDHPTVFVSAGKRGLQVELSPSDLLALTQGTPALLT